MLGMIMVVCLNALFGASFSLENSHIAPNNISSLLYFKTKTCITLSSRIY